jgi:hypothetical protein
MARTFFRITLTDPPSLADFTSPSAKGRTPRDNDPEARRLWDGVSVFATETQARNQAKDFPLLGGYIAQVDVPDDAPVRVERTLRTRGHHTVWADPQVLLRHVVSVEPV